VKARLDGGASCVETASALIDHCLELGSKDNMSVIIVGLQGKAFPPELRAEMIARSAAGE
jgi:serine/threonine protein phosphatase PrpC|tara:strand:+ start:70 stop:249 length:180 start_codon:yes stop_codon:yes gene_type:complete